MWDPVRERLLGHVAEYNAVHPETTIEGTTKPVGSLVIHNNIK